MRPPACESCGTFLGFSAEGNPVLYVIILGILIVGCYAAYKKVQDLKNSQKMAQGMLGDFNHEDTGYQGAVADKKREEKNLFPVMRCLSLHHRW